MKKTNKKRVRNVTQSRAHIKRLHQVRVGLFALLLLALVAVRGNAGMVQVAAQPSGHSSVLAYATSISRSDLLSATNTFRVQNGLKPLALNDKLNYSAQSKAQHMVDNDYWAHVAPDGTQPWYFFDQAGYAYSSAGENLAYGFNTSQDTVNGWIGSPAHRANMLGGYSDVGFGFVNGPNYQGGPNTVVVAHYGEPASPAPAPAPAPAPTPTPPTTAAPTTTTPTSTPPPAATPTTPETPSSDQPIDTPLPTPTADTAQTDSKQTKPAVATASVRNVGFADQFLGGKPNFAAITSSLLVLSVIVGFALTHRSLVRHAALVGERFVIKHPLLDGSVVVAVIGVMLSTTVGRIG